MRALRHPSASIAFLLTALSCVGCQQTPTELTASDKANLEWAEKNRASGPLGGQASAEKTWVKVAEWKGTGAKTTEVFTVTGKQWRVRWSYVSASETGGVMQATAYRAGEETPLSLVANEANKSRGSDVSHVDQQGDFKLVFNCANVDWEATVEEEK